MNKTFWCLGLLVFTFHLLVAQDFNDDLLKINSAYRTIKQLSVNAKYSVYRNHEGKELISVEEGFIKTDSGYQYTKIGPVETLSTPNLFIMINHSDKIILINKSDQAHENTPADLAFDIQKMIKQGTQMQYTKLSSTIGQYSLQLAKGEFERLDIQFGLKDYLLYRMSMYYRKSQDFQDQPAKAGKPLMIVEYSEINKHPKFSENTFSITQFIVKTSDGYKASSKYKDYEIIDQSIY